MAADHLVNNESGFDWVKVEKIDFLLRIGFHVDQLTMVMLAAVTFVGMMVQIYSTGYMKGEPRYGWYFAVLSLFIAAMMTLVLADNFLLALHLLGGRGHLLLPPHRLLLRAPFGG